MRKYHRWRLNQQTLVSQFQRLEPRIRVPAWSGEASRSGLQRAPSHCVLLVSHLGRGLIPSCGPSLMTTPNSHHLPKALLQIPSHCGVRAPTYGFGGTLLPLTFCLQSDVLRCMLCSWGPLPCSPVSFLLSPAWTPLPASQRAAQEEWFTDPRWDSSQELPFGT